MKGTNATKTTVNVESLTNLGTYFSSKRKDWRSYDSSNVYEKAIYPKVTPWIRLLFQIRFRSVNFLPPRLDWLGLPRKKAVLVVSKQIKKDQTLVILSEE